MGKVLTWLAIAAIAWFVWQLAVASRRRSERARAARERDGAPGTDDPDPASRDGSGGRLSPPEAMMRCAVCGVHLPGSEALFARGRVYCSAEHRDQDPTERGEGDAARKA